MTLLVVRAANHELCELAQRLFKTLPARVAVPLLERVGPHVAGPLAAVGTVGLVVAGLGILNTLLMSFLERYREIGIYKAIGASDGDIRNHFLTEAAVLGLAGGTGGLILARAVSWLLPWGIVIA